MAITVPSTSSQTTGTGSVVITKPTGLTVGDQMIAAIASSQSSGSINTPAGWTLISQANAITGVAANIFFKVADSSDVAASNFTFTHTSGTALIRGGIIRATGLDTVNLPEAEATGSSTSNATSYNIAISESLRVPDNLVVIVASADNDTAGDNAFNAHSTTPSHTFTNFYNEPGVSGGNPRRADYSIISNSATITNIALSATNTINEVCVAFAVFRELYPTSGTNATFNVRPAFFSQTGQSDTNGTNATLLTEPVFPTQSGKGTTPTQWTNETQPTTTWTNETL